MRGKSLDFDSFSEVNFSSKILYYKNAFFPLVQILLNTRPFETVFFTCLGTFHSTYFSLSQVYTPHFPQGGETLHGSGRVSLCNK